MDNVTRFLRGIKVYDCNLTKTRIGDERDGGYVALKELCEKTDVVYTFGVGGDVSFELDFVKRFPVKGIKLFDPTINRLPVSCPEFDFFKVGIGSERNTLEDIWTSGLSFAILKMDIEWDEWEILRKVSDKTLLRYSQLLIEFHIVQIPYVAAESYSPYFQAFMKSTCSKINNKLFGMYYEVIEKLNRLFFCYHIHANNSLPETSAYGYSFPPLIELSFVRKDLVGDVCKTVCSFPIKDIDYPNKSDRPDVNLGDILKIWIDTLKMRLL